MDDKKELVVPEGFEEMQNSPIWDYKVEPVFEGAYISAESDIGINHSNLYAFRTKDGSVVSVWGNTILDARFRNLQSGEEVIIHYLGKVVSEKVKGREYHNFAVYHRTPKQVVD